MTSVVNLTWATWLMTAVSGVAWVVLALITKSDLSSPKEFLRLIPQVVTVDAVVIAGFSKWGWRGPAFRGWLVRVPNLNGTWIGEIRSDYVGQNRERLVPIPAMLTVRQSMLSISCVVQTAEMRSDSFAEGFRVDSERQLRQLAYSYSSRPSPTVRERSSPHDGTVLLDVTAGPERRLHGRYWTDRGTTGEIELAYHGKRLLEGLPADMPPHPMHTRQTNL